MDVYTHTFLAVGCIAGAFFIGRHLNKMSILDEIVTDILSKLEQGGFIHTVKDKEGAKELVPISEIIKKEKEMT